MSKIIFSGSANPALAIKIAKKSKIKIGRIELKQFSDAETYARIEDNVKNQEVYLFQSCARRPNHYFMELLVMIDAVKRMKPKKIFLVLPFFPYRRQERILKPGESLTAELIAKLISHTKANKVFLVELHAEIIEKFFTLPIKHIHTLPLFINYFKRKFSKINDLSAAAPDLGASAKAQTLAKALQIPYIKIRKERPGHEKVKIKKLEGDVKNRRIILLDDEINTGSTIIKASEELKKNGAREIYVAATHGIFSKDCLSRLQKSKIIKEIVVTDSIRQEKRIKKLKVVSIADIISKNLN